MYAQILCKIIICGELLGVFKIGLALGNRQVIMRAIDDSEYPILAPTAHSPVILKILQARLQRQYYTYYSVLTDGFRPLLMKLNHWNLLFNNTKNWSRLGYSKTINTVGKYLTVKASATTYVYGQFYNHGYSNAIPIICLNAV